MRPTVGRDVHVYGIGPFPDEPVTAKVVRVVRQTTGPQAGRDNDENAYNVWLLAFPPKNPATPKPEQAANMTLDDVRKAIAAEPLAINSAIPVRFSPVPKPMHWTWPPKF